MQIKYNKIVFNKNFGACKDFEAVTCFFEAESKTVKLRTHTYMYILSFSSLGVLGGIFLNTPNE